ncbi:hypothetical protein HY572_04300 [Candidatus Micrarchaeota archaeon]|nr:hypothetical protein [Candidatus Micrarchaeota archaeon]
MVSGPITPLRILLFAKSPEFFAAYLSGLKFQKDTVTTGLLRCLAVAR